MTRGHASGSGDAGPDRIRIDKWLWHARFFKTRGLAAELAASGKLRLNGSHLTKAAHAVRPGDTLTFPQGNRIRVIRVLAIGERRGPAPEAQLLYEDLSPAPPPPDAAAPRPGPAPDGRERKAARRLKQGLDEDPFA